MVQDEWLRGLVCEASLGLGQNFSRSGCLELAFHPPKIELQYYCWSQDAITCIQLCLICCRVVGNIAPFFGQKSHSIIKQEMLFFQFIPMINA